MAQLQQHHLVCQGIPADILENNQARAICCCLRKLATKHEPNSKKFELTEGGASREAGSQKSQRW